MNIVCQNDDMMMMIW